VGAWAGCKQDVEASGLWLARGEEGEWCGLNGGGGGSWLVVGWEGLGEVHGIWLFVVEKKQIYF
jgi:hypothetical protein